MAVLSDLKPLADTYQLLARLWITELSEPLLQSLLAPPMSRVFVAAGGSLPADAELATLEELAVDYCQLFRGPANHLPPFQSVWQHARFQAAPVESMQSYMHAIGYVNDSSMPDHLGIEMDVMGRLIQSVARFEDELDENLSLISTYFVRHLTWADRLFDLAVRRAQSEFYRSVIVMTREFLESEKSFWMSSPGHETAASVGDSDLW